MTSVTFGNPLGHIAKS